MILRHISMKSGGRSDFARLAAYITDAQSKDHRLAAVSITNCESASLAAATAEVLATQLENKRANGDKTYHLLISFPPGESPPADVLAAIEAKVCATLGFAEHQRISAVHADTDNLHIHVAINKIHPRTGSLHDPYLAYKKLGAAATALEREYGLKPTPHVRQKTVSQGRAADMERHSGVEAFVSWMRRTCAERLERATSWDDLLAVLAEHRIALRERANGFVFEADDGTQVKASTVSRLLSKPALAARLGTRPGAPSSHEEVLRPAHALVERLKETAEMLASYRDKHSDAAGFRYWLSDKARPHLAAARSWADFEKRAELLGIRLIPLPYGINFAGPGKARVLAANVDKSFRLDALRERFGPTPSKWDAEINKYANRKGGYDKKPLMASTWSDSTKLYERFKRERDGSRVTSNISLKAARQRRIDKIEAAKRKGRLRRAAIKLVGESRDNKRLLYAQASAAVRSEIKAARAEFQHEVLKIRGQAAGLTWADWLREQAVGGDPHAVRALRARAARPMPAVVNALTGNVSTADVAAGVAGVTKRGTLVYQAGRSAIRDDGARLQLSTGADQAAILAALKLAQKKYGHRLSVDGTADFKARVIHAAATSRLNIVFTNPSLEQRRRELLSKEEENAQRRRTGRPGRLAAPRSGVTNNRGHGVGRGVGSTGPGTAFDDLRPHNTDGQRREGAQIPSADGKPNVARIGSSPPPFAKNRLRTLSQCGVVRITRGSQVLLQGDVSPRVDKQGSQHANALRWPVLEPGRVIAADNGADAIAKYINERESKRATSIDIPKHSRYTGEVESLRYAGQRTVDGEQLALLASGDGILVKKIDKATAQRLTRVRLDSPVSITPSGSIKTSTGRKR